MLMVVLQHTISGSCVNYENTFFFKAIWSLQMPLFFIISGYVTRYSRPLTNAKGLFTFIKKRTLAYLIPWIVWSFVIRGLIFGQNHFFDLRYLLWHMDTGYWFLVSLWCIVMIYGCADYCSNKLNVNKSHLNIFIHLFFICTFSIVLAAVGYFMGLSFLDIKLTLFYIPLYVCGYVFGQIQDYIILPDKKQFLPIVYAICLTLWLWLTLNFNYYGVEMTPSLIILRYITAICGCATVIYSISVFYKWGGRYFSWQENIHWRYMSLIICS